MATTWPRDTGSPRATAIEAIRPLPEKFRVALRALVTVPAAVTDSVTVPRPTGTVRSPVSAGAAEAVRPTTIPTAAPTTTRARIPLRIHNRAPDMARG